MAHYLEFFRYWLIVVGQDSFVGSVTHYSLDSLGIEYRYARDFQQPSRPALWPIHPLVQWVPSIFLRLKRPGRDVDHSPLPPLSLFLSLGLHGLFQGELNLLTLGSWLPNTVFLWWYIFIGRSLFPSYCKKFPAFMSVQIHNCVHQSPAAGLSLMKCVTSFLILSLLVYTSPKSL